MTTRRQRQQQKATEWTTFERVDMATTEGGGAVPVTSLGFDSLWRNNKYTVWLRKARREDVESEGALQNEVGMTWLSIKRNDKEPIHDWRDLQRIKNELCGREREAIELYPAESRLVDSANQYHLWVLPSGDRVPLGFNERFVADTEQAERSGAKQRPFDEPVENTYDDATLDQKTDDYVAAAATRYFRP